jgi:hypothetical protein
MKLQRAPLSNYRREEALVGMVGGWGETSERYRKNQQTYFSEINSETGRIFPIYFVPFLVLTSYREYGSSFTEKTKDHVNPACLNAAQSPGFRIRVGSQTPRQAPFHLTIRMGSKSKSSKLNHTQSLCSKPDSWDKATQTPREKIQQRGVFTGGTRLCFRAASLGCVEASAGSDFRRRDHKGPGVVRTVLLLAG